jgi:hypothetical protein
MSRDASMKFTPASKGDTYDKMNECAHCYKAPTKNPFPVCSACKVNFSFYLLLEIHLEAETTQEASFCSKECQTKAWPLHK